MSIDLRTQLRIYLDKSAPPVAFATVMERAGTRVSTSRKRGASPWGWVYAVGLAAAILFLIGGAGWMVSRSGESDPASIPPPLTGVETPDRFDMRVASGIGVSWYPVVEVEGMAWAADTSGAIVVIDPVSGQVWRRSRLGWMRRICFLGPDRCGRGIRTGARSSASTR